MNWFKKKEVPDLKFSTRAEAFSYMLQYTIEEKGSEPMEAAKKANEFAEIFAANMGIPLKIEPIPEGVDKYISIAEKLGDYFDKHPKLLDYGIPVVTFLAGLVTERKIDTANNSASFTQPNPQNEPINFDEIPS